MRRRRISIAMIVAGAGSLLASVFGMVAAYGQGEALGGYTLLARAPGVEATEDQPAAQTHPEGQGTIGEATSELSSGTSYSLASVVWPGPLVANLGTLLVVASNGDVPQEASVIRYPARAEARSGQTEPDVAYDQIPGATMTAHASEAKAEAHAALETTKAGEVASFGSIDSHSQTTSDGKTAVAEATSRITDISIGGVIEIGSFTSSAEATTTSSGTETDGKTLVSDVTVAGHPARIDGEGIHIEDEAIPTGPLDPVTNPINDQILSQMGITVAVSQPHVEEDGATTTYTAGSLVFLWEPPDNDSKNVFTITFGGASVTAGSSEGFSFGGGGDFTTPTFTPTTLAPTSEAPIDTPVASEAPVTGDTGTGVSATEPGSDPEPPASTDGAGETAAPFDSGPLADSQPIALFEGITALFGLLALIGTGLLATGLFRLADGALLQSAVVCDLEREVT